MKKIVTSNTNKAMDIQKNKDQIILKKVCKNFQSEAGTVSILKNIDLTIDKKEMIVIQGRSGSGKSTLLNLMATLDEPSSGSIQFENQILSSFSKVRHEQFRANSLGFIFQHHYLLPDFSVLENVMFPLLIQKKPKNESKEQALELLVQLGLEDRIHYYPKQISGGEMARCGIARALIGNKQLILADEPTGNLDEANSNIFIDLIEKMHRKSPFYLILVTHDDKIAKKFEKSYMLQDGHLLS